MSSHFITHIKINNFKCFDQFQAADFQRVNLISGRNNIGKTALLEALYFSVQPAEQFIPATFHAFLKRNVASFVFQQLSSIVERYMQYLRKTDYTLFSNHGSLAFKEGEGIIPSYLLGTQNTFFTKGKATTTVFDSQSIPNILTIKMNKDFPAFLLFPSHASINDLSHFYQSIQEADKEDDVSQYLTQFDPDITRFKIFSDQSIKLKKAGKYQDISTFGDGLKAYIAIILALYSCKNGYLFIDEIENGIHYTQLEHLWQIVLSISKEINCQVFATTHSKECLEAYGKIAQQQQEDDIAFITLLKNRQNQLQAITYSDKTLADSLMQHHEVRG